jgi:hypothetical protein
MTAPAPGPVPPARLAALTVAVLAVHAALLRLGPAVLHAPQPAAAEAFVTRRIDAPPAPAVEAATAAAAEAPPATPRPRRARAPGTAAATEQATPAPASEPPSAPPPEHTGAADARAGQAEAPAPAAATPASAQAQAFAIPGSARHRYEVVAERFGLTLTSAAELTWRHDGREYEAQLEVGGGIVPRRIQRSTGLITPEGLAPLRFSDRTRSETATHFERDKGKLTFSNNKPDAAWVAGIQDRLSVIVQLAAMVGGAPSKYARGTSITVPTAGTSDAESWIFTVEGEEDLQLPGGRMQGLKLQRVPRKQYDVKVELWLAPGMDYAPVRLRLTTPNGDSLDQRWLGTDRG